MKIQLITPSPAGSTTGNRVTAERWAGILSELGHRVGISQSHRELAEPGHREPPDLLIALHARKSAESVEWFSRRGPVVLALTGTDLYDDIRTHATAQRSLELAWRLVALQSRGTQELSESLRSKVRVIVQSVQGPTSKPPPLADRFEVVVSGHLRPVKDPFRTAHAVRLLPASSKITVTHLGGALSPDLEEQAQDEMASNPRYRWLGEVPRGRALEILWRSRLLVLTSSMEGGANVICEALAGSVPVLSTRIPGSIGLLGEDYPGYFEVGDTQGLGELLGRAEEDSKFYASLGRHVAAKRSLVDPQRELEAWRSLLLELDAG